MNTFNLMVAIAVATLALTSVTGQGLGQNACVKICSTECDTTQFVCNIGGDAETCSEEHAECVEGCNDRCTCVDNCLSECATDGQECVQEADPINIPKCIEDYRACNTNCNVECAPEAASGGSSAAGAGAGAAGAGSAGADSGSEDED